MPSSTAERFAAWIERRAQREPAQQIVGDQEFYGLSFEVDRHVLVPRPETEMLVDAALTIVPPGGRFLDLGTGSGCIAIAIAVQRPDVSGVAIDRSAAALSIARRNGERHGVADRIEWHEADFGATDGLGSFDLVVSNPPYIPLEDWKQLQPEVRDWEPHGALVGGDDGLDAYRALLPQAFARLNPGGSCLLELGIGQDAAVRQLAEGCGFSQIRCDTDLNGIPRRLRADKVNA